ncbi:MAG: ATP-binding protein [Bacteroidales bacterium]|jgi:NadR type nicotinamide-nucleotide adenylyltransferase
MIKRIAITGPESSGKTELAEYLARYFDDQWVPEFSRQYLNEIGLDYQLSDVEAISRAQYQNEKNAENDARKFLFCDSDFTVTKIWCEVVFGNCPQWIENKFKQNLYDLYLLCFPDIPWQPDPLRQNPNDRRDLFWLYKKALEKIGANFRVVDGLGELRNQKAVSFVHGL